MQDTVDMADDPEYDEDEPSFSDPEDFEDDIEDEELLEDVLREKPLEADGIDSVVVVDNVPQVGPERLEKLKNVVHKIFSKFGKITNEFYPEADGLTKGYIFLEYGAPAQALEAVKNADGYKLDKQHTFRVNVFTDFDKYMNISDEWETPEKQDFKDFSPAGASRLVDACCVCWPSGRVCVVVAGERTVCVWRQDPPTRWSLLHTWTFTEPVIGVFPVPDAVGLLCVTLGHLEIRETRVLSCSSLSQVLLCDWAGQTEGAGLAVVGVAKARVASSAPSAARTSLQVFSLAQDGSVQVSQPLVSPGVCVCVRALAAVDGLTDALIGSTDGGHLVVWNMRTGHLLQRISLAQSLTHTSCLRGYSYGGGLFVLLRHPSLGPLEEEGDEGERDEGERDEGEGDEEKRRGGLFSLLATNPLTGASVLTSSLHLPGGHCGGVLQADVHGAGVVGVTRGGGVCVWELEGLRGRGGRMLLEGGARRPVRWGADDTLLLAAPNGELCVYHYRRQTTETV